MSDDILVKLVFSGSPIIMQCKNNEYMRDIFKRFATKVEKSVSEMYFLFGGDMVSQESQLSKYSENQKEIILLVNEFDDEDNE